MTLSPFLLWVVSAFAAHTGSGGVEPVFETLMSLLGAPPQAHIGEAFMLHESLAAFYFLRVKALIYERHAQSEALQNWWHKARMGAFEQYIRQHSDIMTKLGLPMPATLPETSEITDQFIAMDGAAMVKGMMEAHVRGLHAARRPDVAMLYRQMLDGALIAGAELMPIIEKEGWITMPPTMRTGPQKA